MSPRWTAAAIAGVTGAVLAAAGCTSITLRASEARTPVLLGPVACIGCAPEPGRVAAPPTVAGGVHEREYVIATFPSGALDRITDDTVPLDVAATTAVADPCREDLRVAAVHAGTWSFHVPLIFGIANTWIDAQASRAAVPNGVCGVAPWPSVGPTGIDKRRP
ncbi:MAG TPA: hypothetical protein VN903_22445 [Polyangia bacterium]|nr:hypothetical protein [Polyangia bacterium]